MVKEYIPDRGDIALLNFNPQVGKEQAGRRPALVISPKTYNKKVGLAIFCPISSQEKGYPFEVTIPHVNSVHGVILSDHVKSLDWRSRKATFLDRLEKNSFSEVIEKMSTLIS